MSARKSSRLLLAAAFATTAVAVATPLAAADAVYHSQHIALNPIGGAPLRSGFVENIHADGPQVYAHELYVLRARFQSRRRASRPTLPATVSASSSSAREMCPRR